MGTSCNVREDHLLVLACRVEYYPGILAKYFAHAGDVLDRVADEEDEDNQQRYVGQALLSLS